MVKISVTHTVNIRKLFLLEFKKSERITLSKKKFQLYWGHFLLAVFSVQVDFVLKWCPSCYSINIGMQSGWMEGCRVLSSHLICVKLLYDVALMSIDVIMVRETCVNRTPTWKTFVGTPNIKQSKATLLRGKNSNIANRTTV